jgi:hypothetical protein
MTKTNKEYFNRKGNIAPLMQLAGKSALICRGKRVINAMRLSWNLMDVLYLPDLYEKSTSLDIT